MPGQSPLDSTRPEDNGKIGFEALASVALAVFQIPWGIAGEFVFLSFRMLQPKSVALDTILYAMIAYPAFASIVLASHNARPSRWTEENMASIIVGLLSSMITIPFFILILISWYNDIWRDPNGYWGWI
jgi:hypothetical protein